MKLATMKVPELKAMASRLAIPYYGKMKKAELIKAIVAKQKLKQPRKALPMKPLPRLPTALPPLPPRPAARALPALETYKLVELKELAKRMGLQKYSQLRKAELLALLKYQM